MDQADRIKVNYESIGTYLENLKKKKYQIPTFQREVVWKKDNVKKLWDSIYKFYPIGSILIWRTDIKLQKHRKIGGHEINDITRTRDFKYILDGQQRTTSLLTSLYGGEIKDKEDFDPTLYIDLTITENEDEDDSTHKKRFLFWDEIEDEDGKITRNVQRMKNYKKGLIVPLRDIRENYQKIEDRILKMIQDMGYDSFDHEYRLNLRNIKNVLDNYKMAFIELKGIEINEVTEIFERINQEGKPLDIFDIIVAKTFRPETSPEGGFYLREMIQNFKEETGGNFSKIGPKTYLQMLAIIIRQNINGSRVHNITDTYLNNIKADHIEEVWEGAKKAFRKTFDFLENHLHLKGPKLIPYRYFYMTISSYFYENDDPDYELLKKYYWYYSFHTEDKLKHTQHLRYDHVEWLENAKCGEEVEFEPFMLDRDDLRKASYSYRGRYSRAVLSLLSNQEPKDWKYHDRSVINQVYYELRDKPELHHIFPLGFVESYPGGNELNSDSLMNIAFIPKITNLEISDRNPIDYLKDFDHGNFEGVFDSHLIPKLILEWSRMDELGHKYLDEFIEKRIDLFEKELKNKLEGIEFNVRDSRVHDVNVRLLIEEGEGQHLEFKSTLRTDLNERGMKPRHVEYQSLRAIASFLNSSQGGKLLIGVQDDGNIYGLKEDYQSLKGDQNREVFKRHIHDLISKYLGGNYNDYVVISFYTVGGKDICMVDIEKADVPSFIVSEGDEEFYVRRGNRTVPLSPKEQTPYINRNFDRLQT